MKMNMAVWDRTLRILVGVLLTGWAVAGGPWWAYLGLGLLATAAWRFSPLYSVLRIGTFSSPESSPKASLKKLS